MADIAGTSGESSAGDVAGTAETIEESGRRIGHHAWLAMRLFETVGGWVPTVPEPAAKALLAAQSHHHAWHAELWLGLLPALDHLPQADLVVARAADADLVDRLAAAEETVARLAALHQIVLPHLRATYTAHRARTTAVTDGPTVRVLRLVRADLDEDDRALAGALASLP
ncbi:MAG TPA: hypothetical protein VFI47_09535 [Acidimicrobiales bacterium]|nr:hypothetical protein [Acidimicrobiales bacterium]